MDRVEVEQILADITSKTSQPLRMTVEDVTFIADGLEKAMEYHAKDSKVTAQHLNNAMIKKKIMMSLCL